MEASEPVPDLVVVAPEVLPASGRLLPAGLITMVVEVVSRTSVERDYCVKRAICAAGGIPACLIVDPVMAQCVLLTRPEGEGERADYKGQTTRKFGEPLRIEALGVALDTSGFGTLPDVKPHRFPLP
ncbi:Uma2 family endonuclease [Streptomyces anandii]|uniref:Uma2 family endonuclease n=1 Tax=Streptomyces anandii TaxID=285454 RepID=UPI00378C5C54